MTGQQSQVTRETFEKEPTIKAHMYYHPKRTDDAFYVRGLNDHSKGPCEKRVTRNTFASEETEAV